MWILAVGIGLAANDNWPQFRGAGSLGVVEDPRLPDRWSTTENVAWVAEIPGQGLEFAGGLGRHHRRDLGRERRRCGGPERRLGISGASDPPQAMCTTGWCTASTGRPAESGGNARCIAVCPRPRITSRTRPRRRPPSSMASASTPTSGTSGCSVSTWTGVSCGRRNSSRSALGQGGARPAHRCSTTGVSIS